jgi:hypothetical protein
MADRYITLRAAGTGVAGTFFVDHHVSGTGSSARDRRHWFEHLPSLTWTNADSVRLIRKRAHVWLDQTRWIQLRTVSGRTYQEKTIKILFGRATWCAYPRCHRRLIFEDRGNLTVVAQIAHIRSESPDGPRHDAQYPVELINSEENLLLLCGIHHKPVDDHESAYTIEELIDWKTRQVASGPQREFSEQQLAQVMHHAATDSMHETANAADQDRGPAGHHALRAWLEQMDALGRGGDPHVGLVRINVPPRLADTFIERPDVTLVAAAVESGQTVILTQPDSTTESRRQPDKRERVLAGLGGVGKSQLAAQYARQVWNDPTLDLIIWVAARDIDQIVDAYAKAAARLLGADPTQPETAAARLMEWLSTTSRRWLIVLDDVQVPADVQQWWPEPTEAGQVIVTTRYRGDSLQRTGRQVIEVGLYTPEQALDYLRRRLADSLHLCSDADGRATPEGLLGALAEDLGHLPLALAHASAYLREEQTSVVDYRALFADYRNRLETLFVRTSEFPDPYLYTVETTWAISITLAARLAPGGVVPVVMLLASLLDPDGIPRSVFFTEAIGNYLEGALGHPVEEREVRAAVRILHRLNLLTDNPAAQGEPIVTAHALVQRATRDAAAAQSPEHPQVEDLAWGAADALLEVWPDIERDTELAKLLRSNTQMLASVSHQALWNPEPHQALLRTGDSLGEAGLVSSAITYFDRLHDLTATYRGPDNRYTLVARSNLACWRGEAGDLAGAAAVYEEVLEDSRRVLGPDHPDTLATHVNLAALRGKAGDPAGAMAANAELLATYLRVLGPDHPHTLTARSNVAYWRGEAGDPAGAVTLLAELLKDRLRVLGPDHPDTLVTRSNLARFRGEAGDAAGAVAAYEEVLEDLLRVLGPDNPETLATHSNLAYCRGLAGDLAGAVAAHEEVLQELLRVLGPDNPETLATRNNLTYWRLRASA